MTELISRQAALRQAINAHKMAQENGFDFKDICEEYLNVLSPVTPQVKFEQEPFMNKPCVAHKVCHEDKVKVLDKIKADVINIADGKQSIKVRSVLRIIDKYKAESEGKE